MVVFFFFLLLVVVFCLFFFVYLFVLLCFGLSTLNVGLKLIILTSRVPRSSDWASWVPLIFFVLLNSPQWYFLSLCTFSLNSLVWELEGQAAQWSRPALSKYHLPWERAGTHRRNCWFSSLGQKLLEEHVGPLFTPDGRKVVRVNQGPMTRAQKINLR